MASEAANGSPLVLLIGAPLPPPYGGIARYMQLCLPAMARQGYRVRIVQPDQGVEPQPLAELPPDADVKTSVFSYPGALRLRAGFCAGRSSLCGCSRGTRRRSSADLDSRPGNWPRPPAGSGRANSCSETSGRRSLTHTTGPGRTVWPRCCSRSGEVGRAWCRFSATFFHTLTSCISSTR